MRSTGVVLHFGFAVVVLGQSFNLLDVEDGVTLHVVDLALGLLALVIFLSAGDGVGVNDQRAFLALADVGFQLKACLKVIQMGAVKPLSIASAQSIRMLIPE
jgi:hypothetical protein